MPDSHEPTRDPLGRYWDALAQEEPPLPESLDPALAEAIRWAVARDDAPGPHPAFVRRLEEQLQTLARTPESVPGGAAPVLPASLNGRVSPGASRQSRWAAGRSRRRWALAHLATAALVLLTLIGSFVALRSPLLHFGQEERPAIIPAVDGPPEATILMEGLVTNWPASGPPLFATIQRIILDPGMVEESGAAYTTGAGPDLFTVESGQVAVDADGPVVVTRGPADRRAEPTTAPVGTTIVLDEGDQLFAPSEVSIRRRNDTAAPAGILDFRIADLEQLHRSGSAHYVRVMPDKILNAPPAAPAEVALHRLRLLPGRSLPISDLPGLQMLYVEEGTLDLMSARGPGDLVPESWTSRSAGSGMSHFETTTALANLSPDPVTFLVATIESVE